MVMATQELFEDAVQRHGPAVLRVCRTVLGPGADADDAWSETFLAALRAWPGLADGTNIEARLVRVAQRKAVDVIRSRARRPTPVEALPDALARPGASDGDGLGLWQCVAGLPEKQRLAVAYHYFGGLPHAETAELIGGTSAAVRRAAADGIKALRRTYHEAHTAEGGHR